MLEVRSTELKVRIVDERNVQRVLRIEREGRDDLKSMSKSG
jgi:hypothetical protein